MATKGAIAKRISDSIRDIEEVTGKLSKSLGVTALDLPQRSRFGTDTLQAEQLEALADYLNKLDKATKKAAAEREALEEELKAATAKTKSKKAESEAD